MARTPEQRLQSPDLEAASALERYGKDAASHVFAIQKRFDAKVASRVGFDGSIFEFFKTRDISAGEENIYKYKSNNDSLYYEVGSDGFKMAANGTSLNVYLTESGDVELAMIHMDDFYNIGSMGLPTSRSVDIMMQPATTYEIMRVGQKKSAMTVSPLIYGDLDEDANVMLHLSQPIYVEDVEFEPVLEADRLVVAGKKGTFYFPYVRNLHHELMEVSDRLGV